jgi:hypothetical protein
MALLGAMLHSRMILEVSAHDYLRLESGSLVFQCLQSVSHRGRPIFFPRFVGDLLQMRD